MKDNKALLLIGINLYFKVEDSTRDCSGVYNTILLRASILYSTNQVLTIIFKSNSYGYKLRV